MIEKFKSWWCWHKPILTTPKKQLKMIVECEVDLEDINKKYTWATINPVVHSLKELRKNTWDVGRVDHAIQWLKDNFEVENER